MPTDRSKATARHEPSVAQVPLVELRKFHELLAHAPEDERWELIGGRVMKMMVGARWGHARIVSNLHIGLGRRLQAKGSPCRLFAESFRVEIGDGNQSSFLPDIIVACTSLPAGAIALTTPTILMEVLSDDTAGRDRGVKLDAYRTIATLQHYVLVERDRPCVEVWDRLADRWRSRKIDDLGRSVTLEALDLAIPLAEIYADLFA